MRITEHFTYEELTRSAAATKNGIDNTPGLVQLCHLAFLASEILEPLRAEVSMPIIINSGYRCQKVNALVGGVANSYHLQGKAADIKTSSSLQQAEFAAFLKTLKYCDLIIMEPSWLHVQWSLSPRHSVLDKR